MFSLAARKLGAKVYSFDYDTKSVACTNELKRRYFPQDPTWIVEQGSVLDAQYIKSLGKFDVVYSWGVLHHTGAMWRAVVEVVAPHGKLFIALYNDHGRRSKYWLIVKKMYNASPIVFKAIILFFCSIQLWGLATLRDFLFLRPFKSLRGYAKTRGMSPWRDVVDWVGGYPFEVSKPEEIFSFYKNKEFILQKLKTCGGGLGCNEFVFQKIN